MPASNATLQVESQAAAPRAMPSRSSLSLAKTKALVLLSFLLSADGRVFNSLPSLDALRANATGVHRDGNLDVMEDMELCHFVDLSRYSLLQGTERVQLPWAVAAVAAVALALEHLNTGNGSIIKEVEGLSDRCKIRFTAEFLETDGSENRAVDQVRVGLASSSLGVHS